MLYIPPLNPNISFHCHREESLKSSLVEYAIVYFNLLTHEGSVAHLG